MHPKLKLVLYGLSVFVIYSILTYVLRYVFNRMPTDAEFFGVYSSTDLLIGLVLALILTFTHVKKNKLQ